MKILVTGGAGYIGSHTTLALLKAGHEVVVIDDFSNSSKIALERVAKLALKDPVVTEGSILDKNFLRSVFEEHNDLSAVIHFAALKAVGESTEKPLRYYENNVSGSILLLKEMERAQVDHLVFSSSCTVYGEPRKVPVDESHPVGEVSSPYGRTKSIMECIINDSSIANPNLRAAILRYFNPVGADKSGEIGEDPNGVPDNLVPFVCQVASGKLSKLKVFGTDYPTRDGTAIRDYLHVSDLADAHLKALEALTNREGILTCNLGTGKGSSVLEVIKSFEKVTGISIPHELVGRRSGDVTEAWADPSMAEKILGWKAKYTLDQMLADAWNWQNRNPNGYS